MKVKKYNDFLLEEVHQLNNSYLFEFTNNFKNTLIPLRETSKVARILLSLTEPIKKDIIVDKPANYIDIVLTESNYGYISYLKEKYNDGNSNPWTSPKRITQKATKAIREFFRPEFIEKELTNLDFETFINQINASKSSTKILELRGEDLLRAYNYTKELPTDGSFGVSCANFYQKELSGGYPEPSKEWYDVYTKNPNNCGVVVVINDNKIVGRKSFQQGENLITENGYIKGQFGTVKGYFYGVGGRGGKYDVMINSYLNEKYKARDIDRGFMINMETRFRQYPPFDSMKVCFEYNLLADNSSLSIINKLKEININNPIFTAAYKAYCPTEFVSQRLKEESQLDKPTAIMYNEIKRYKN